jgi:hypothetical protein
MISGLKKAAKTPAARDALLTATHAADSRLIQAQDAYVTATFLQNLAPVLQALPPDKDVAMRIGALLILKVDGVLYVRQLTAAQQAVLDHPHLAVASPDEIITALGSSLRGYPEVGHPKSDAAAGDGSRSAI